MSKTLKVYPNPWGIHPKGIGKQSDHGLDQWGHPCLTLLTEFVPGMPPVSNYVGARVCAEETRILDDVKAGDPSRDFSHRSPRQLTTWEFQGVRGSDPNFCQKFSATQPVEVPETGYYIDALRNGTLLPSDGRTAKLAGYSCRVVDFPQLEAAARALCDIEDINARRAGASLEPLNWAPVAKPTLKKGES